MEKLRTFLRQVKTVLVPYLKTGSIPLKCFFLKSICIYIFYYVIDYVTLSLFYATDISFICLMTCVDNKPLKRCKISIARLLEQCEDAYWCNYV